MYDHTVDACCLPFYKRYGLTGKHLYEPTKSLYCPLQYGHFKHKILHDPTYYNVKHIIEQYTV